MTTDFTSLIDLAAERVGGAVMFANDDFFAPKENLLKASAPVFIEGKYTERGKWMDGWESRRRRTPGFDWCLIRLGLPGRVRGLLVDTAFFKGNYPDRCFLQAAEDAAGSPEAIGAASESWPVLLPEQKLEADKVHVFQVGPTDLGAVRFVRLNIIPDGGVSRMRLVGRVAR